MYILFVPYDPPHAPSRSDRVYAYLAARRKNGTFAMGVRQAFSDEGQGGAFAQRKDCLHAVIRYITGEHILRMLRRKADADKAGPSVYIPPFPVSRYEKEGALYHFLPIEQLPNVRRNGLRSPDGHVFLTDDPAFLIRAGYPKWKAVRLKRDITYCILEIDTLRLRSSRSVWQLDRAHEQWTDFVPPECIR